MSKPQWALSDAELLEAIRDAVNGGAVPQRLADSAKATFTWRSIDEDLEVMSLVGDSAVAGPVGVRGSGTGDLRLLDFHSDRLGLEVEVSNGFVIGQLIPMQAGHIRLSTAEGTFAETAADETGSFRLPRPDSGPVRLVCVTDSGELATEWTRL